jgi:uncharacterized protein
MRDFWRLYDELIEGIPTELVVEDCLVGLHWILVRTATGTGMAMTPGGGARRERNAPNLAGRNLREVAERSKSWNFLEAAIGIAAMNAWYNTPTALEKHWNGGLHEEESRGVFEEATDLHPGGKIAVVGHFPGLEETATRCQLSILERVPQTGDFPDPACEAIFPLQDAILITGTTFMNKTVVRLLELGKGKDFYVVGPTTPLSPILLDHGATQLAGSSVIDVPSVRGFVAEGGERAVFRHGTRMVRYRPSDRKGTPT